MPLSLQGMVRKEERERERARARGGISPAQIGAERVRETGRKKGGTCPEQRRTSPYATLRATKRGPTSDPLSSSSKLCSPLALTCGDSRITHFPPSLAVAWLSVVPGRESDSRTVSPGLARPKTVAGSEADDSSTMLSLKSSDGRTIDTASVSESAAAIIVLCKAVDVYSSYGDLRSASIRARTGTDTEQYSKRSELE